MHERSLAKALLDQVAELVQLNGDGRVTEIRLRVGPLSNVEPLLLASAFVDLSSGSIAEGALLSFHEVELVAQCHPCGQRFEVINFCFRCPFCEATDVNVVDGDCVMLERISLAELEVSA